MIRNYDELIEYMAVQRLIVREPRPSDGQMAMNCTPEGAQVCYMILALIGAEDRLLGEGIRRRVEREFREATGTSDDVDVEFVAVSPVQDLINTVIAILSQHPRFGEAIMEALERRG